MKKCTQCGEIKELKDFGKRNRKKSNGNIEQEYLSYCKKCNSNRAKARYYKIKEKGLKFVYRMLNANNEIIYIGKTTALSIRIAHHFSKTNSHLSKEIQDEIVKIQYLPMTSTSLMDMKEIYYINLYKPKYNTKHLYDECSFVVTDFLNDIWFDYDLEVIKELDKERFTMKITSIFKRLRGNNYLVYVEYKDINGKKNTKEICNI